MMMLNKLIIGSTIAPAGDLLWPSQFCETFTDRSAQLKGVARPVAAWLGPRGRLLDLSSRPTQAKHEIAPVPVGLARLLELHFEAIFDPRRIFFLVISCSGVTKNRGNAS